MVPSFGLFEFEPSRKAFVSAEDQERAGYLSEVVLNSTEFGAGNNEAEARHLQSMTRSLF
ncbi:hypothetical protein ACFONG_14340 [Uliginosibacterium paludis]|uniref:Uncharacterized protein n=1 Tax=Uliginosibacterium paludis TaxID=1615952 RepID=A0ABV2CVQ7_9RHOO